MIDALTIDGFRGIHRGALVGFGPVTVLTGPNGCGKSAVLDALLIAGSADPADALGRAISHHPVNRLPAEWLVNHRAVGARIGVVEGESSFSVELWIEDEDSPSGNLESPVRRAVARLDGQLAVAQIGADGRYHTRPMPLRRGRYARLVDTGVPTPLTRIWADVVKGGAREQAEQVLQKLLPGARAFQSLQEQDGSTALYVEYEDRAVPVALCGDGIQAAVQILLNLAVIRSGGLALIEEPEVFQHPRAIGQTVKVLWEAAERGVQLVVTTHSIEIIDGLLAAAGERLSDVVVLNLKLEGGELACVRAAGPEAVRKRQAGEDLR
jgi:hypothetical protein